MYDIDDLKNLVDMAAGGRSPADLLITNAKLVDVLTGEIRETDVSVGGGKILGFSHTEAVKVVDARGAYLLPGLIDAQYGWRGDQETQPLIPRKNWDPISGYPCCNDVCIRVEKA